MVSEALTAAQIDRSKHHRGALRRADGRPVEWLIAPSPVAYPDAVDFMRQRAAAISDGDTAEAIRLVEQPPLYTAGTSAQTADLLEPNRFPVFEAGRGGQYTYHGPGQRVAYTMLDLRQRGRDIRALVQGLEAVGDRVTLEAFNIRGELRDGRIGVWVRRPDKPGQREDKIAALGIRVSRWVSFHGISLNVSPDLAHYSGIVPCGIADQGVTSFEGSPVTSSRWARSIRSLRAAFGAPLSVQPSPPDRSPLPQLWLIRRNLCHSDIVHRPVCKI